MGEGIFTPTKRSPGAKYIILIVLARVLHSCGGPCMCGGAFIQSMICMVCYLGESTGNDHREPVFLSIMCVYVLIGVRGVYGHG